MPPETTNLPTRPVLRYHGGKWVLASWVISHFPAHRVYVEPFGGAASVLMQKPRSYSEVLNDQWDELVSVFRCLRDPEKAAHLQAMLEITPFSRSEMNAACAPTECEIEKARRVIVRSFMGFGTDSVCRKNKMGFRSDCHRTGTTPAHDWANYPAQIAAFTARLRGVVIENKSAISLIPPHDSPETLFYCDPPYPLSTRSLTGGGSYVHEMTDDDHRDLAKILHSVKGMVILSGYPCPLYDEELYQGWVRVERTAMAHGALKRTEVLWLNGAAANAHQKALPLFGGANE